MARFKVRIRGEQAERARESLNRAGIPTIGPLLRGRDEMEPAQDPELNSLAAVLDAEAAEEAHARVSEALPEGDYTVERPEPLAERGI
jgi:hypothetical protein